MVDDLQPLPDTPDPAPGDEVTVYPGTLAESPTPTTDRLIVADVETHPAGTLLLLHLPQDHPRYWDWAAYTAPTDVHTVTRYGTTPTQVRTWTLPQP
ncbi:DUF6211 family protein [Streptomyces sp. NPDC090442]|uniref:DUF6211 family protein n=1 Tax=Streptomyces sp. NPDC090442 TaxID=3365962 RepID=UPI00382A5CD9